MCVSVFKNKNLLSNKAQAGQRTNYWYEKFVETLNRWLWTDGPAGNFVTGFVATEKNDFEIVEKLGLYP
jgi:hypothetical protein